MPMERPVKDDNAAVLTATSTGLKNKIADAALSARHGGGARTPMSVAVAGGSTRVWNGTPLIDQRLRTETPRSRFSTQFCLMARPARWEFALTPRDPPLDATPRHVPSRSVNADVRRNTGTLVVIIRDMYSQGTPGDRREFWS